MKRSRILRSARRRSMKEEALLELSGVSESVSSSVQDMFQVEETSTTSKQFRRKSLEKVSRIDLSPIRSQGSENEATDIYSAPPKRLPRERQRAAPAPMQGHRGPMRHVANLQEEQGELTAASLSFLNAKTTNHCFVSRSSMAAPKGIGTVISLPQMQAELAKSKQLGKIFHLPSSS